MPEDSTPPPSKTITTRRGYTRTLTATHREYQCSWCYATVQEWHYPGPAPRYCAACRHGDVRRSVAAASVRRTREQTRATHPPRPVGRPRRS